MSLTHRFFTANTPVQGFWAQQVFKDVYTLKQLERNILTVAFPDNTDDLNGHDSKALVGDAWEAFGEIYLDTFGLNKDTRTTNNVVCPPGQKGYDYTGTHPYDAKPTATQAKFVAPGTAWETELAEGEKMKLERFMLSAQNDGVVDVSSTDHLIVFTNAKGINYFTNDVLLYKKVRCIGRPQIEWVLGSTQKNANRLFWDHARQLISAANPHIQF